MSVIPSGDRRYVKTYSSESFPLTENPVFQNGIWVLGGADGLDRNNMQTTGGRICGTQSGNSGLYDDSLAILGRMGGWSPDTFVKTRVHSVNQQTGSCFCELEHLHRFTITANQCKGYEVNFRANHDGSQYIGIVIWLGPLGIVGNQSSIDAAFAQIGSNDTGPGIFDGDDLLTTCQTRSAGVVITAFIDHHDGNGFVQASQRTDTAFTYLNGNPGVGHWLHLNGATGVSVTDYSFDSVRAGNLS